MQKKLSKSQIEAFHHYHGNDTQVENFLQLVPRTLLGSQNVVVDIGGGCGFFASALQKLIDAKVRVIDTDLVAIETCLAKGVDAAVDDALKPKPQGDEDVVVFNLILHHLVGTDELATLNMQRQALGAWINHAKAIFVTEYIYDSYVGNISGRLIYFITSSRMLSAIASMISRFVPSLRANTFGVGVRFRARMEWIKVFEQLGFRVVSSVRGAEKGVSLPRRLLLIRSCREDGFLLQPETQTLRCSITENEGT